MGAGEDKPGRGEEAERRGGPRARRRLPVRLWNDSLEGRGFTVEVSRTGMLVETARAVDVGDRLHLEIEFPDAPSYFTEAVVVRRRTYPRHAHTIFKPTLGLRFLPLDEVLDPEDLVETVEPETVVVDVDTHGPEDPLAAFSEKDDFDPGPIAIDLRDRADLELAYERDIKHGGVRAPTSHRIPLDTEVTVTLMLPEPHGSIDCKGSVVTHAADLPEIGVLLEDIDPVRALLLEILRGA